MTVKYIPVVTPAKTASNKYRKSPVLFCSFTSPFSSLVALNRCYLMAAIRSRRNYFSVCFQPFCFSKYSVLQQMPCTSHTHHGSFLILSVRSSEHGAYALTTYSFLSEIAHISQTEHLFIVHHYSSDSPNSDELKILKLFICLCLLLYPLFGWNSCGIFYLLQC